MGPFSTSRGGGKLQSPFQCLGEMKSLGIFLPGGIRRQRGNTDQPPVGRVGHLPGQSEVVNGGEQRRGGGWG